MAGVLRADRVRVETFTGLRLRQFEGLLRAVRERGGNGPGGGRPWCLRLADRALLVAVHYRTNLTMRQLAPLFGISSATVCRGTNGYGPAPGNKAGARIWRNSGLPAQCQGVTVLGDGACLNTGLLVPHRKRQGRPLRPGEEEDNAEHRKVRARVEHAFVRMKNYKVLRDCRQRGGGLHHTVQAVAHMHNLALAT
ncbi:transposase family protein [Streptomyces sp. NPDC052496]|uniref:transposase family protein n=1 Tax=Streptomyces sp. NPDC052496 TaxID=3154951 RepID=UPI003414E62D